MHRDPPSSHQWSKISHIIRPLLLSIVHVNQGMLTYFLYHDRTVPNSETAWYINANGTHILVDTGITVDDHKKYADVPMEHVMSFEEALGTVGLEPADIDILIITHLHYDHCAYASRCVKAKVVIQEAEIMFAYSHHPVFHRLYDRRLFDDLNLEPINGEQEIVSGLRVIPVVGHTPGCQAVCVDTAKGRVVLTGMCTINANFYPSGKVGEIWPVLIPTFHMDAKQSYYDMLKLKALADILVPAHEVRFATMKQIPEF